MNELSIKIYTSGDKLPEGLEERNIFHSKTFFMLVEPSRRQRPYMVTVERQDGTVVAQMLGVVRFRCSWFPPYLYRHCRILGEGVYHHDYTDQSATLFGMMLKKLTTMLGRRILYIEVSNLSEKMYGYRQFREAGYFPVRWMSIHNSLHSRTPEERLSERMKMRIQQIYKRGVETDIVQSEADFKAFSKLIRRHHWLKPKRYIPEDSFFRNLINHEGCRLYVTRYHQHIIGCSVVFFSQQQAYLWFSAFRRKSFAFVHPDVITIWHALKDAHRMGYEHMFFLDVGLPFKKNRYRDFILRFGGKPTSTYRWFHFSVGWLNHLLSIFYKE
ncbi:MAG: GNAT family N-acetyltransferase [Prevotella sp.]|nr:GNAT family N-acetyltransferase [Prevotella sp.]